MKVIESVISAVRQGGIRLSFFTSRFELKLNANPQIEKRQILLVRSGCDRLCNPMAREFKAVGFFVMMGVVTFLVCGVTAFYTQRAVHGRTPDQRAAYWTGGKAGEQSQLDAKLPMPAELNLMVQKHFEQRGSGNKQDWDLAFEHGYEDDSTKRINGKNQQLPQSKNLRRIHKR
jgi:hypothetical protein